MKKLYFWIAGLISFIILFIIIANIIYKIQFEALGPVPITESKRFNFKEANLSYKMIETTEDIHDYIIFYIEIENITPKRLYDFNFTLKLEDDMRKYAPFITSESSKKPLNGKNSNPQDLSNFAFFTHELLITKPSLLSEYEKEEMKQLLKKLTLQLSWQSGIEILELSENDFINEVNF